MLDMFCNVRSVLWCLLLLLNVYVSCRAMSVHWYMQSQIVSIQWIVLFRCFENAKFQRPRNMRNEHMKEHIQPTGELMANISGHTSTPAKEELCPECSGNSSTSCLCKPKDRDARSVRSVKSTKNKPFPCLSDNYEKRSSDEEKWVRRSRLTRHVGGSLLLARNLAFIWRFCVCLFSSWDFVEMFHLFAASWV